MKYLLDTHVVFRWAIRADRLEKAHKRLLERAELGDLCISAITLWELAMLTEAGRIKLANTVEELLAAVETLATTLPLTPQIAIESTRLGARMHGDPSDKIIVATARCHTLTLLTSDRKLIESGLVTVA